MQKLFGSKQTLYKLEHFVSLTAKNKLNKRDQRVVFLHGSELSARNGMGNTTGIRRQISVCGLD